MIIYGDQIKGMPYQNRAFLFRLVLLLEKINAFLLNIKINRQTFVHVCTV